MNVTHAPWPLLELEVVHSAPVQLTINYLEDNLSSSLAAAFVVCHCTGTDCTDRAWEEQGESFLRGKSVTTLQPKPAPNLRGLTAEGMRWHRALGRHDRVCGFERQTRADRPWQGSLIL